MNETIMVGPYPIIVKEYCPIEDMSMLEMSYLTHETQVAIFNWCGCEDNEGNENPYDDCPKGDTNEAKRRKEPIL